MDLIGVQEVTDKRDALIAQAQVRPKFDKMSQ
jgi:hypothetical protein